MFSLKTQIAFKSKDQAKNFFSSLKPELEENYARSETKVLQREEKLIFEMKASDKTALRASLNSLMKPLILFNELEELE